MDSLWFLRECERNDTEFKLSGFVLTQSESEAKEQALRRVHGSIPVLFKVYLNPVSKFLMVFQKPWIKKARSLDEMRIHHKKLFMVDMDFKVAPLKESNFKIEATKDGSDKITVVQIYSCKR